MIALLFCMVLTSILTVTVIKKINIHIKLKKTLQQYNCIKEYNGKSKKYISFMKKTNWIIKNIHNSEIFLIFFPHLTIAKSSIKFAKNALKKSQTIKTFSYLEKIRRLKATGCPISINAYIAPYNVFKRNKDETAPLRKREWNIWFISEVKIRSNFQITNDQLKITTTQYL